ncbi:hypothetical protein [Raineya orbicola]|jgi:hypothetical protein|uniref:Uncharacterized protein n=1 Tax=Raineya orbicola TaxID=2016530 RepID=A0A2N3IBH2_9BACT|nr:hypothetical protein [Raineya orbicola]PKQ67666.1 hypothetical protein Rain11_1941 [Raineya orbicola]
MELTSLKNRIIETFTGSMQELEDVLLMLENDKAIFPFNEYELLICTLIEKGGLTHQQYMDLRTEYINANPNLWIFEITAPRDFGEKFAQTYIQGICPKLKKPDKQLDPNYSGDYDFYLDGIRVEVKASRAVDSDSQEPLYMKALSRNTEKNFLMNFQQLKPACCDVFVWLAVFRDQIVLWVMSSKEVMESPFYSKGQHRGNKGNEGQLHIRQDNIHFFKQYELIEESLEKAIRKAAERNQSNHR